MSPAATGSLTGEALARHYHACVFYSSQDEKYHTLTPFIREGLERGEKAIHITDPELRADHLGRLAAAGLDVESLGADGRLEVMGWEDAYLRGGQFSPPEMIELLSDVIRQGRADGFSRMRIIGQMDWAQADRPGVDRLLEYEARVTEVLAQERQLAVCAYDLNQFTAATMMDVLRTHPMVVIGGVLYENPFFVPPADFLRELEARAAQAAE